jgi:hypothetical protein
VAREARPVRLMKVSYETSKESISYHAHDTYFGVGPPL